MSPVLTDLWHRLRPIPRTPLFQQIQASECGAASLGIVLAHLGRWARMNELCKACGVSRDGCSAADIQRAAAGYGVEVTGWQRSAEYLKGLGEPAILFWEFNHFLVLEGFRNNRYYINDPANGHYSLDEPTFRERYMGIVLVVRAGPDFTPSERPLTIRARLLPWLGESRTQIGVAFVLGLLLAIPTLALPELLRYFTDAATGPRPPSATLVIGGAFGVAVALFAILWIQQRVLLAVSVRIALLQSERFLSALLRLPMEYFAQRFSGELASRARLLDRIANTATTRLTRLAIELTMSLIYLVWIALQDWLLAATAVLVAFLNVVVVRSVYYRKHENHRLRRSQGMLAGIGATALSRLDALRATGTEGDFFTRLSGYQALELRYRQRSAELGVFTNTLPPFFLMVGGAVVLGIGGMRVISGDMSIGDVVATYFVIGNFLLPIGKYVESIGLIQILEADLQRVQDVLDADPASDADAVETPGVANRLVSIGRRVRLAGRLELRDVTFGYRPHHDPVIEGFDLTLEPGQRVALVGPSGSGKSTIASLIAGVYRPWSGQVLFDGHERGEIPREVVIDSVAHVNQRVNLFSGTVRENLTMWNPTVPDALVVDAAQDAHIHDEIAQRPLGYDTTIEEGGQNFSGGQRQRLEIARALVPRPSLIILDEATSDLDAAVESRIDDSLRRRGCACLIVAHRLSTIRDCDEILVLDRGRTVQRGQHEELMADDAGLYHDLVTSQ
ncbi:MAG: ATP-binding cassette domain-containing protein [Gammaproteobacteria bacterium]|nr:ATP-binding cassette domain-containing protein [Gammaproteobacteria bacterium]